MRSLSRPALHYLWLILLVLALVVLFPISAKSVSGLVLASLT
jgi:hypothetical protein